MQLCTTLGRRVYQKYLSTIRRKNGFIDKLRLIYDEYMKHITNQRSNIRERQKWNELVKEKFAYMVTIDNRANSKVGFQFDYLGP